MLKDVTACIYHKISCSLAQLHICRASVWPPLGSTRDVTPSQNAQCPRWGPFPPYLTAVAHTKGPEPLWLMVWSLGRAGRAGQGRVLRVHSVVGHLWVGASGCGIAGMSAGQGDTNMPSMKGEMCWAMGHPGLCRGR